MRHLILALLICVGVAQAAEVPTTMNCFSTQTTLRLLEKEYGETPVFLGRTKNGYFAVMLNKSTGSFTSIEFDAEITCVYTSGEAGQIIDKKSKSALSKNAL